jgi:hypothetical protein
MPSTMSKLSDDQSDATPPRRYPPKRQKIDPEVNIKITYQKNPSRDDHILHVLLMQAIIAAKEVDIKMVNKRGEALKEEAVADLTNIAFHSNHFNIKQNSQEAATIERQRLLLSTELEASIWSVISKKIKKSWISYAIIPSS